MAIAFSQIPANLRTNGWYFEVDSSQAGGGTSTVKPALLMAQRTAAGAVPAATLHRITSAAEAAAAHGQGSQLHRMAVAFRAQDPFSELWTIGVADPAGAASTLDIVVTGPATASGTLHLYIGGQAVNVTVTSGDAATAIAAAVDTAVNAANDLPVTSVNVGAPSVNITLTALNLGTLGDEIDVRANYRLAAGGESWPAGVTITAGGNSIETTPVRLAAGAGVVNTATAITALGDTEFDFVAVPWNADATLDVIETEWNDTTGRWSPLRAAYGHVFAALDDTVGNLTTAGNARNSQHSSLLGIESCPAPPWELAGAVAGQVSRLRNADVAAVYHTAPLNGILPPRESDRFTASERSILLTDGVTPTYVDAAGVLHLEDLITTWQLNGSGVADESMLDVTTMYDLMHIQRTFRTTMSTAYGQHRIADDGTNFGPGKKIVTPSMILAAAIALFRQWESDGIVEDFDTFASLVTVERDATNKKRINVLLPPDVTNAMVTGAVSVQFRR